MWRKATKMEKTREMLMAVKIKLSQTMGRKKKKRTKRRRMRKVRKGRKKEKRKQRRKKMRMTPKRTVR